MPNENKNATYHGLFDLLDADRVEPLVHVDEPFRHHFQMVPLASGRGCSRYRGGRGYRIRGGQATAAEGRLMMLRRHGTGRVHGQRGGSRGVLHQTDTGGQRIRRGIFQHHHDGGDGRTLRAARNTTTRPWY